MSAGTATRDNAGLLLAMLQYAQGSSTIGGQVQEKSTKVVPARSSIYWPGAGVPVEMAAQAAEVGNFVAIPVTPGDVFRHVGAVGSKTAAGTVAEYITGLYVGEAGGALLAQSKSATPSSHPKEEQYNAELESTVTITKAMAPKGYVYSFVADGSAGTQFGFVGLTYTTALQAIMAYMGGAGAAATPMYGKGGSAIKGTAEAVVPTLTAVANVPAIVLF